MDDRRFDAISRALAAGASRRWFARAIASLRAGALIRGLSGRRSAGASGTTDPSTPSAEGCTDCGGACIDPQTDENHCGGCGQAWAPDRTCCAGACVDSAPLSPPFSGYTPDDDPDLMNPERGMYFGKVPAVGDSHTIVARWLWLAPWCKAELIWDGPDSLSTSQVLKDYAGELEDARAAGYKVLFRPRYDKDEDGNPPGDCTFEGGSVNVYHADRKDRQLRHISAVAKMLGHYKDVIAYIHAGYLGKWGEWNLEGGISRVPLLTNATNPNDITTYDRSHIIDHILSEYAAAGITQDVELRTPVFAKEVVERYEDENKPPPNIGLHNDCFMSSMQSNEVPIDGSDSGTYSDFAVGDPSISLSPLNFRSTVAARAWAVDWTKDSSFGGETCPRDRDPEDGFSDENERWRVCDNMIGTNSEPAEPALLNMSYLNADFVGDKCRPSGRPGGQCLPGDVIVPGAVTTWTSGGCYDEIRHRLGYRFHVTSVEYTSTVAAGQSFQVRVNVKNTGWAKLHKPRQAKIVLRSGSLAYHFEIPEASGGAVASWAPDQTQTTLVSVTACPPPPGTYEVRLWIPDPDVVDPDAPWQIPYAVKLATKHNGGNVFDPATGENDLGVEIVVQ